VRLGNLLLPMCFCVASGLQEGSAQFVVEREPNSAAWQDPEDVGSPSQLATHARQLLSREPRAASDSDRIRHTLKMLDWIDEVRSDSRLYRNADLRQLQAAVTRRLRRTQERLKAAERRPRRRRIEVEHTALHQLNAAAAARLGGAAPPAQPADYGPLLVTLIQETISPSSWDVNGGKSTIVYYRPAMALVVRAPQSLHGRLGPLLGGLRRE
jgi:hypothetical protein